jgi:hypothetical protein
MRLGVVTYLAVHTYVYWGIPLAVPMLRHMMTPYLPQYRYTLYELSKYSMSPHTPLGVLNLDTRVNYHPCTPNRQDSMNQWYTECSLYMVSNLPCIMFLISATIIHDTFLTKSRQIRENCSFLICRQQSPACIRLFPPQNSSLQLPSCYLDLIQLHHIYTLLNQLLECCCVMYTSNNANECISKPASH